MTKWISVKERLPEDGIVVLCSNGTSIWTGFRQILTLRHDSHIVITPKRVGWFASGMDDEEAECCWPTDENGYKYWMPLPPLPEEPEDALQDEFDRIADKELKNDKAYPEDKK